MTAMNLSDGSLRQGDQPSRPVRPVGGFGIVRRVIAVGRSLEETFSFFSDARNLDAITPSWVGFSILTPQPIAMCRGTVIDYRIRIRGLPIRWRTEITEWEPPHRFVDLQLIGPYRWWRHEHRFEPCEEGTRIIDEVEYRAPLHFITHPLFVRRDVDRIFDYRASKMAQMFGGMPVAAADVEPLRPALAHRPSPGRCNGAPT